LKGGIEIGIANDSLITDFATVETAVSWNF